MAWIESLVESLSTQSALWGWLFAGSVALLLISPIVAAWLVVRLPADYFVAPKRPPSEWRRRNPALRLVIVVGKNLLGIVLLVAGLVMLLTPGQGLLTVLMGLLLVDFPGRDRVQRWLVIRRPVWRSMNWLRRRAGCKELERPR